MAVRIEVSGVMASGKSTLCDAFERHGFPVIREDIKNNPYFAKVQEDPDKYNYPLQQHIIKDRERGIIEAMDADSGKPYLIDYCLAADKAYIDFLVASMPEDKLKTLYSSIDDVYDRQGDPSVVIHLRCDIDEILERVKKRGREFEQTHTQEYFQALSEKIERHLDVLRGRDVPVLEFDTTRETPQIYDNLISKVMKQLPR